MRKPSEIIELLKGKKLTQEQALAFAAIALIVALAAAAAMSAGMSSCAAALTGALR